MPLSAPGPSSSSGRHGIGVQGGEGEDEGGLRLKLIDFGCATFLKQRGAAAAAPPGGEGDGEGAPSPPSFPSTAPDASSALALPPPPLPPPPAFHMVDVYAPHEVVSGALAPGSGGAGGKAVDVFRLGATLYTMLHKCPPCHEVREMMMMAARRRKRRDEAGSAAAPERVAPRDSLAGLKQALLFLLLLTVPPSAVRAGVRQAPGPLPLPPFSLSLPPYALSPSRCLAPARAPSASSRTATASAGSTTSPCPGGGVSRPPAGTS